MRYVPSTTTSAFANPRSRLPFSISSSLNTWLEVSGSNTRCRFLVLEHHVRRQQRIAVLVREEHHRLGDVAYLALHEARLIVHDERDDVPPGNVALIVQMVNPAVSNSYRTLVMRPAGTVVRIVRP